MTVKTEGQYAGEFIVGELHTGGEPSRESGTLTSGQTVVDGEILSISGSKLVAHDGALNTEGDLVAPVEGIAIGNHDASAGDVAGVPYFARMGAVKDAMLTYPEESTEGGEKEAIQDYLRNELHIALR